MNITRVDFSKTFFHQACPRMLRSVTSTKNDVPLLEESKTQKNVSDSTRNWRSFFVLLIEVLLILGFALSRRLE